MRINTNVAALNSYNQLKNTQNNLSKSLSRLSSGKRINGAADDAAGLAISEKMKGQTSGLAQAQRNAQDGISMIQTAEGALKESHSILQRMRELSVQSANDTNTEADRGEIQKEVDQLAAELTRIGETTEFNTQNLLDGTLDSTKFQIGANEGQNMEISINDMQADALGVASNEGVSFELSEASNQASGAFASEVDGTTLDVVELGEETTIEASGSNTLDANYGLKNSSGEIVGVSASGTDWFGLNSATTEDKLSTVKARTADISASAGGASFEDSVTTGTVTLSGTDAFEAGATGTVEFASDEVALKSGEYEVVDSGHALVDTGHVGIINENDELVAISSGTDMQGFNNLKGDKVFTSSSEQNVGETITVSSDGGVNVSSQEAADNAISILDDAIAKTSAERSKLGAVQNRLDHTINNLNTAEENLTAAESRISDVDMAKEMMNMSKQQILSQAGTAMMAQANQLPQGVLQLLG